MSSSPTPTGGRCAAAHPEDPSPCAGPRDAVTVYDRTGTGVPGCEHHGARLFASLDGGCAVQRSVLLAGARVALAAAGLCPFPWRTGTPGTGPVPSLSCYAANRVTAGDGTD
ncbi:hypothetical protein GCM10010129_81770 [Streptomyces fumigatiscleroticus]|nr:hypothetical protein GCM10010129_81770 [Streptomyces fumigatiscleroticus]